jgi:hypothetical protein
MLDSIAFILSLIELFTVLFLLGNKAVKFCFARAKCEFEHGKNDFKILSFFLDIGVQNEAYVAQDEQLKFIVFDLFEIGSDLLHLGLRIPKRELRGKLLYVSCLC